MDNYIFEHMDGRKEVFTRQQIIENALFQRSQGVQPSFRYNFGRHGYSEPGYLVASGKNGAIVCSLNEKALDGAVILTGWQGDFIVKP